MKGSVQFNKGYYYPVIYDNETKKHKWGKKCTTKRLAEKELRTLISNYESGSVIFGSSDTFSAVFENWKELIVPELYESKNSRNTNIGYINHHVIPHLGNVKIDKITPKDCQMLFFKMKKLNGEQMSPATKRKILGVMNSIFNNAIDWGFIVSNPCENVKLKQAPKKKMEVWTSDETNLFLNYVKGTKYYLPFLILATTGMRRGEVCGLRWSNYDGCSIYIDIGMDIYGSDTSLKTDSSHRKIELMSFVKDALEEQKRMQAALKNENSSTVVPIRKNDFICTDDLNNPIKPGNLTTEFRRFIVKYNNEHEVPLQTIRLHDLRHGFATLALANGENIKVVSEILGHAKTSTTQNIYQHATETMQKATISRLEERMFKTT